MRQTLSYCTSSVTATLPTTPLPTWQLPEHQTCSSVQSAHSGWPPELRRRERRRDISICVQHNTHCMYIDYTERAAVSTRGDAAEEGPEGVQVCHHETIARLGGGDRGMKGGKDQGGHIHVICVCMCMHVRVMWCVLCCTYS